MADVTDKRAPMASAPMKYAPDGSVDWGNMWDSFCVLAREGGPPHRATMLHADETSDPTSAAYQTVVAEIVRGIGAVSGLRASAAAPGWVAVECASPAQASWLAESIIEEHVQARCEGALLLVPAGQHFTLKGEIKNVITAVAKTTHYWSEHLPPDAKRALALQLQLAGLGERLFGWMRRR
jgi:sirohydrochlorin cobaltochelatase